MRGSAQSGWRRGSKSSAWPGLWPWPSLLRLWLPGLSGLGCAFAWPGLSGFGCLAAWLAVDWSLSLCLATRAGDIDNDAFKIRCAIVLLLSDAVERRRQPAPQRCGYNHSVVGWLCSLRYGASAGTVGGYASLKNTLWVGLALGPSPPWLPMQILRPHNRGPGFLSTLIFFLHP